MATHPISPCWTRASAMLPLRRELAFTAAFLYSTARGNSYRGQLGPQASRAAARTLKPAAAAARQATLGRFTQRMRGFGFAPLHRVGVRKESGPFIEELSPRTAQLVEPYGLRCVQLMPDQEKITERARRVGLRCLTTRGRVRPSDAIGGNERRARRVGEKQRAHLVWGVVMDPVPPFWHVFDSGVTHPVRRRYCKLLVEVRVTVSPHDERRKIDSLRHEPLARDVAKACAIPVQPSVKRAWRANPFKKITNDVVRKTVGHE